MFYSTSTSTVFIYYSSAVTNNVAYSYPSIVVEEGSVMTCAVMAKAQNARNISRLMSLTFTHDRLIIARIICWLPQVLEQVSRGQNTRAGLGLCHPINEQYFRIVSHILLGQSSDSYDLFASHHFCGYSRAVLSYTILDDYRNSNLSSHS